MSWARDPLTDQVDDKTNIAISMACVNGLAMRASRGVAALLKRLSKTESRVNMVRHLRITIWCSPIKTLGAGKPGLKSSGSKVVAGQIEQCAILYGGMTAHPAEHAPAQ